MITMFPYPAFSVRTLFACFLLLSWVSPATATVRLNEIMASNSETVTDEDGDSEDWIELHNSGTGPVDLSGWGVSDDPEERFRWTLPAGTTLGAGEFLLIWASGKDRPGTGGEGSGELHTNFSISLGGEDILLTDPEGVLVDFLPPTSIPNDVSIGRAPGEGDAWFFFDEPTPGGSNDTTAFASVLEPVAFSHKGGFHEENFELTLSHPDPDAEIIYTLDGSTPDIDNLDGTTYRYKNNWPHTPDDPFGEFLENSFRSHTYNGPVPIVDRSGEPDKLTQISSTWHPDPDYLPDTPVYKGTPVQARAYKPGALPSYSSGHTYFVDPDGNPFDHPILSLQIQEDLLFGYERGIYTAGSDFDTWRENNPNTNAGGTEHWTAPYNWQRRGDQWEYPGRLEFFEPDAENAGINQGMGFRIHGNASRGMRSKSLRLYARSEYDSANEFEHRLFSWDPPFVTNPENDVFNRIFVRGPGSGGPYMNEWTVHKLMGELFEGVTRVRNVIQFINGEYWGLTAVRDRFDQHHVANHFHLDPDNVVMTSSRGWGSNHSIDVGESSDMDLFNAMRSFILNQNMADDNLYRQAEDMLSMRSYIDHIIPNIYFGNTHYETGFWRAREPSDDQFGDGRWRIWTQDFEYSLNTSNYLDTAFNNVDIFRNLLDNNRFRNRFINRFADLINTTFAPERVESLVLEEYARLGPDLADHEHRWNIDYFLQAYPWEPHDSRHTRELNDMIGYAYDQPDHQRQRIRNRFGILDDAGVTLDVSDPEGGHVRINTVEIHEGTPGVGNDPYPWTGVYFNGVPIELEAIPEEGYRLAGWQVDGSAAGHVSIRDDLGLGEFEVGVADEGERPYTDEAITITSLPQELAGSVALKTANAEATWLIDEEPEATPETIEWTYTDAVPDRNQFGGPMAGANTTLADGSGEFQPDFDASVSGGDDWGLRAFANEGTILQAFGGGSGGPANTGELKTTLRDLEPGTYYPVTALFWQDSNLWTLRAGLSYGNDLYENELYDPVHRAVYDATTFDWTTGVLTAEGNREMRAAFLGNAAADENGEIDVFVHDVPTNDQSRRTWYDGVAVGSAPLKKGGTYLAFEVDRDTTVYVINHPSSEPDWLTSNFSSADLTVGTTAGTFDVWELAVDAGDLVVLPGNGGDFQDLNYWVVLRENEPPDNEGPTDSVISLTPTENMAVTAVFERIPLAELPVALHEWDFEDAATLLEPSFTVGGGLLSLSPGPGTEASPDTGGDFETAHLRVNNPLGSVLTFSLPTTGYEDIVLEFLTRRSGQGAGVQSLSYTTGGETWSEFDTYTVFDSEPQFRSFDFSEIPGVSDNPDFAVRITFEQGDGGTAGNNRFDDVALSGVGLADTVLPPVVNDEAIPERVFLAGPGDPAIVNVEDWFTHPNDADLTFQVASADEAVLTGSLDGSVLTLSGLRAGGVTVTVQADDGENPAVEASFDVVVYPEPFSLAGGDFSFDLWSPSEPAGSFPGHMLFLQSDTDDPGLQTDLLDAYHIPSGDAAQPGDVDFPYAASSRSRINGLGDSGISFINTGRGRDVGSALVALDTTGASEIDVSWTAGTISPNERIYGLRLEYRTHLDAEWADLPGMDPIEYVRHEEAGHEIAFGPVRLPAELEEQENLQLQWRYYHLSGTSGPRAEIRLDDIHIVGTAHPLESFSGWVSLKYPELSPEEAEPQSDPEGEGVSLLMQYALDRSDDSTIEFQPPVLEADGDRPALRFLRYPEKTDIAYIVEAGSNLEDWDEVLYDSRVHEDENNDGEWMRIADSVPFAEGERRRFLRLRIVQME